MVILRRYRSAGRNHQDSRSSGRQKPSIIMTMVITLMLRMLRMMTMMMVLMVMADGKT